MGYLSMLGLAKGVKGGVKSVMNRRDRDRDQDFDALIDQLGLERKSEHSDHSALYGVGVFALGLAAGSALGMLFAPKRGQELRSEARHMAREKIPFLDRSSLPGQEQIYQRSN